MARDIVVDGIDDDYGDDDQHLSASRRQNRKRRNVRDDVDDDLGSSVDQTSSLPSICLSQSKNKRKMHSSSTVASSKTGTGDDENDMLICAKASSACTGQHQSRWRRIVIDDSDDDNNDVGSALNQPICKPSTGRSKPKNTLERKIHSKCTGASNRKGRNDDDDDTLISAVECKPRKRSIRMPWSDEELDLLRRNFANFFVSDALPGFSLIKSAQKRFLFPPSVHLLKLKRNLFSYVRWKKSASLISVVKLLTSLAEQEKTRIKALSSLDKICYYLFI